MSSEENGGAKSPPFTLSGGNIVLVCYGPVIVTDRPLMDVLRELDGVSQPSTDKSTVRRPKRRNARGTGGTG